MGFTILDYDNSNPFSDQEKRKVELAPCPLGFSFSIDRWGFEDAN